MAKKMKSLIALSAFTSTLLFAGGDIVEPVEPKISIPKKEIVTVPTQTPLLTPSTNVKYDGFYIGGAYSFLTMNETLLSRAHGLSLVGGYYFNKFIGVEGRYTRSIGDLSVDSGSTTTDRDGKMTNIAIYAKPIFNITTGMALYGLAGYGKSTYEIGGTEYSEKGMQWGLGAKYELANKFGFFVDYTTLYDKDNYDGINAQELLFDVVNIGSTYTF